MPTTLTLQTTRLVYEEFLVHKLLDNKKTNIARYELSPWHHGNAHSEHMITQNDKKNWTQKLDTIWTEQSARPTDTHLRYWKTNY